MITIAIAPKASRVSSGLSFVAVPLMSDLLDLEHYAGRYLLGLGTITFLLAAIDTILEPLLPLPLDHELAHS